MPHFVVLFIHTFQIRATFLPSFSWPISLRDRLSIALRISGFHLFVYEALIKYGVTENVICVQITSYSKMH